MPNTPLNPDAVRAAFVAVQAIDGPASIGSMEVVDVAVAAYLTVTQPLAHDAKWWIERANVNDWEDCEACLHHDDMCPVHYGINHVAEAVAQPVVNSFDPRVLNRKGWTCGCEPGNYDSCDDCQSACNELANFLNRPEVKS